MVTINIICVGKLKEKYLVDACREYAKRLTRFCKLNIVEVAESRLPDSPGEKEIQLALEKEGRDIAAKITRGSFLCSLCIEGAQMPSEDLAARIGKQSVRGYSEFVFIIGGSHGLSQQIKNISQMQLSMSAMTFPHQLARIMLLEQIYRAFTIQNYMPYHK